MPNLIEKATSLAEQVTLLKNFGSIGPKTIQEIDKAVEHSVALVEQLKVISEIIDISRDLDRANLDSTSTYWKNVPDGVLVNGELDALVKSHSETLRALWKASIDITRIRKFSQQELSFSSDFGNDFTRFQSGWKIFKRAITFNKNIIQVDLDQAAYVENFLVLLKKYNIISNYSFDLKFTNNGILWKKQEKKAEVVQNLKKDGKPLFPGTMETRFILEGYSAENQTLVTGDWFTGFAYRVFQDQLERLSSPYEIYSTVTYQTQGDISRKVNSDFDVIVNFSNRILIIECKSGKTDEATINSIIEKNHSLKRIFQATTFQRFDFILLHNPFEDLSDLMKRKLLDNMIQIVTPDTIRSTIMQILNSD